MIDQAKVQVSAIIPAAGLGTRMGSALPKVLLKLAETTIIEQTIAAILSDRRVKEVVLAVPKQQQTFEGLFIKEPRIKFVVGEASRRGSVSNALNFLESQGCNSDLILIHDGARPLVSVDLIARCIDAAVQFSAVTAALPVVDTIKRCDKDLVAKENVQRDNLWAIQTPQVFKRDLILKAHRSCTDDTTDDATLVEKIHPVKIVMGERSNLKVTTAEDLELAKVLITSSLKR